MFDFCDKKEINRKKTLFSQLVYMFCIFGFDQIDSLIKKIGLINSFLAINVSYPNFKVNPLNTTKIQFQFMFSYSILPIPHKPWLGPPQWLYVCQLRTYISVSFAHSPVSVVYSSILHSSDIHTARLFVIIQRQRATFTSQTLTGNVSNCDQNSVLNVQFQLNSLNRLDICISAL